MSEILVSSMKLAEAYNTSDATIRNWTAHFAAFLSDNTRPNEGAARQYTPDDVKILSTVAIMRQQNKKYAEITKFLESGETLEWTGQPIGETAAGQANQETAVAIAAFQSTLQTYENRIDKMQDKLEEERAARLAAEIRAAKSETEVELLRQQREEKRPSFWQRLTGNG